MAGKRLPQPGDRIKDNDPRMPDRVLTIEGFRSGLVTTHGRSVKAICRDVIGRRVEIDTSRIHADSKPRKSGFSLLEWRERDWCGEHAPREDGQP